MTSAPHWHGYGPWTGPHDIFAMKNDHQRRPGPDLHGPQALSFISSSVPPLQNGHYLLRRAQTKRQLTWVDVDAVLAWLVERYAEYPPDPKLSYQTLEARIEHSRKGLLGGSDGVWHYSQAGDRVVVYAAICCPHRHHAQTPCPLPPS